jgi:hypothetical protein
LNRYKRHKERRHVLAELDKLPRDRHKIHIVVVRFASGNS